MLNLTAVPLKSLLVKGASATAAASAGITTYQIMDAAGWSVIQAF